MADNDIDMAHAEIARSKNDAHASNDTSSFVGNMGTAMNFLIMSRPFGDSFLQAGRDAYRTYHDAGGNQT